MWDVQNMGRNTMLLVHNFDERRVYGCFQVCWFESLVVQCALLLLCLACASCSAITPQLSPS